MRDGQNEQEASWELLYDQIRAVLTSVGTEDYRAAADCWIDDDNIGTLQHKIYVRNLRLLRPDVVTALQGLLVRYPRWEIVIAVSLGVRGKRWPEMGVIVRPHEIVDGLRRSFFPEEFRGIQYEGSRPGTDRD